MIVTDHRWKRILQHWPRIFLYASAFPSTRDDCSQMRYLCKWPPPPPHLLLLLLSLFVHPYSKDFVATSQRIILFDVISWTAFQVSCSLPYFAIHCKGEQNWSYYPDLNSCNLWYLKWSKSCCSVVIERYTYPDDWGFDSLHGLQQLTFLLIEWLNCLRDHT